MSRRAATEPEGAPRGPGGGPGAAGACPVLELVEVTKRFGDVVAVDRASFRIAPGEFFSLLGPSGCGKTTTLRILAGFERPTSGRVLIDGRDASGLPPHRRDTNMVFQSYALFPHMTVYENVAFGPRRKVRRGLLPRDEVDRVVRDALATVRMEAFAGRYPRELSGGQQQRVALARALANRPRVLLLDEPLGALDLKLRQEMQFELKRIQREVGISFVYVTHDQGEALTMSDRVAVMNAGRIEHLGPPEEVYERPATAFVAGFIGSANLLPCRILALGSGAAADLRGRRLRAAAHAPTCRVGGDALLMLRPEHLRLTAGEPAPGCGLPVRVLDRTFQGPEVRFQTAIEGDGLELVVLTPAVEAPALGPGDPAWATWRPDHAYLLPAG
ncbi:MAG TPA: ABC transporter ATP-binding protein [Actinomycetota bacterium]|nr:ABC transporter ATP-binding protein [Actinomycetota bacterium]